MDKKQIKDQLIGMNWQDHGGQPRCEDVEQHRWSERKQIEEASWSSQKARTNLKSIPSNKESYEGLGDRQDRNFEELQYLRAKLEETQTRLNQENAFLREHLLTLHQQLEKLKLDSEALRRRCADLESQKAKQELRSQEAERSVREAETGTSGQKLSASKETKPDAELTDYVRNLEKKLRETDEMHRDFEFLLQSKDSEIASHNEQVVFLSKELTSARQAILELTYSVNKEQSKYDGLYESHEKLEQTNEKLLKVINSLESEKRQLTVAAENAEKMKVQAFKTIEDLSAQLQRQKRQVSTSSLGLESDQYLKSSDTELQRNVEKDLAQVLEHKQQLTPQTPLTPNPTSQAESAPLISTAKKPRPSSNLNLRKEERQNKCTFAHSIRGEISKHLSETTLLSLVETVEAFGADIEALEADNWRLMEAVDKLTRLLERQRVRDAEGNSRKQMEVDDQLLFEKVVRELEREKHSNRELTKEIDGLSEALVTMERDLLHKTETVNHLIRRPLSSMKSSYHESANLKRHFNFGGLEDRRARSNILHQADPTQYKGQLELIAREAQEQDISEREFVVSRNSRMETKLQAYEKSLIPDLEKELAKYRRLYDDALFALNEKTAQAEELFTDLEILKSRFLSAQKSEENIRSERFFSPFATKRVSRLEKVSDHKYPTEAKSRGKEQPNRLTHINDLLKSMRLSAQAIAFICRKLSEIGLKMIKSKTFPVIRMENIYTVDFDQKDPSRLKVKLVDLEIASKGVLSPRTRLEVEKYSAPELSKGAAGSAQSMSWNLGVLLLEMLSRRPLKGSSEEQTKLTEMLRSIANLATTQQPSQRLSLQSMVKKLQEPCVKKGETPEQPETVNKSP